MNWKIEFILPENYMRVTSEGVYNPEDHLQMMKETLANSNWKPGTPVLLDNRKLDYSQTNLVELEKSSRDMLEHNRSIGNAKIAFLTNSVNNYHVIRQFELITEEDVSAWMHAFLDENQAVRWLLAYRQRTETNLDSSQTL